MERYRGIEDLDPRAAHASLLAGQKGLSHHAGTPAMHGCSHTTTAL
jgi:hypothetical protein